jgi:hypothetical protein
MEAADIQYKPVSTGDRIITLIISMIPVVNIVMLLIWAFGSNTNPSKANWAKAYLAFIAFFIVLYVLLIAVIGINMNSSPQGF